MSLALNCSIHTFIQSATLLETIQKYAGGNDWTSFEQIMSVLKTIQICWTNVDFCGPIVGCFTSGSTSLNTVSWSSLKWVETIDIEYRISSSQMIETFRLLQAQNNCMCCIKVPLKPVCPKFKTHRHLKRLPFRF